MGQPNWWRAAFWQDNGLTGLGFLPKVIEDLPDHHRVFDAGNHLHYASAFALERLFGMCPQFFL